MTRGFYSNVRVVSFTTFKLSIILLKDLFIKFPLQPIFKKIVLDKLIQYDVI